MAITYTISECETQIAAIDAKLDEAAGLPDDATVGSDEFSGVDGMWRRLKERRAVWVQRLLTARRGCGSGTQRRVW